MFCECQFQTVSLYAFSLSVLIVLTEVKGERNYQHGGSEVRPSGNHREGSC